MREVLHKDVSFKKSTHRATVGAAASGDNETEPAVRVGRGGKMPVTQLLGKVLAARILPELEGGPAGTHDPSTAALIARLRGA